jgi:exopolyphosphatase/guanosine-5'-triphosphate,3'-diphosphate pyrophosphatase
MQGRVLQGAFRAADVLAAIDVGTNAARLKIARVAERGRERILEPLVEQRAAIQPGEGVFRSGLIAPAVARRILRTMRQFASICRGHGAHVRAIATSPFRDAKNGREVAAQVMEETGIRLEVVSGREEAYLVCLALDGEQAVGVSARTLILDIGGGSTEVILTEHRRLVAAASIAVGALRLAERFDTAGWVSGSELAEMRAIAARELRRHLATTERAPALVYASSGTASAVIEFASGGPTATRDQIRRATSDLLELGVDGRQERFEPTRAAVIVPGAVILETLMDQLGIERIQAAKKRLRDGILRAMADGMRSADAARAKRLPLRYAPAG